MSFNFMAAVTICSDFGASQNKVCHFIFGNKMGNLFPLFPHLFAMKWWDWTGCHDLSFLNVEF